MCEAENRFDPMFVSAEKAQMVLLVWLEVLMYEDAELKCRWSWMRKHHLGPHLRHLQMGIWRDEFVKGREWM